MTLLQSLAIIGAAVVILGRSYRSPSERALVLRFTYNKLALIVGGIVAVLVAVTAFVDGYPSGAFAGLLVGAVVATAVDLGFPRASRPPSVREGNARRVGSHRSPPRHGGGT